MLTKEDILVGFIAAFDRVPLQAGLDYWLNDTSITTRAEFYRNLRTEQDEWRTLNSRIVTIEDHIIMYYKNMFNKTVLVDSDDVLYWAADVRGTSAVPVEGPPGMMHATSEITLDNVHYVMMEASQGTGDAAILLAMADAISDGDGSGDDIPIVEVVDAKIEAGTAVINLDTGVIHNYYDYDQETWITGTSGLTSSDYSLTDIRSKSDAAQKINAITFSPADFETEYTHLYNKLLGQQMGTIDGNDSVLNKLFALIDAESDVTPRERLSMKKNAYMQMLNTITSSSQQLALQLADKKHKFEGEIRATTANTNKIVNETDMLKTKEEIMLQQVIDNRRIKAMDSLGDTFSTGMAGGLVPSAAMWNEYFRIAKELVLNDLEDEEVISYQGTWAPVWDNSLSTAANMAALVLPAGETYDGVAADRAAKGIGHYWLVDLTNWNRSYPDNRRYNEALKPPEFEGTQEEFAASIRWKLDPTDAVEYTIDEHGATILVTQIGTPIAMHKTDEPHSLCSLPLDGVNYWRHGDIVYVKAIRGTAASNVIDVNGNSVRTGIMVHTYRRIEGLAAGTSVTVASDNVKEVNDAATPATGVAPITVAARISSTESNN